ncbi:bifunctional 4-hydroxy-2-oxoglutarate aldolase/2-dehydro-3-deoxy-phosphogluconate aldolase [Psychrosphaera sp. F3M07]|jgi:2-dehydro-3-deoxyphosphogluconate aldolase/(4S)-4-hydroxy-2-oxoglutarate aldolase|uniref:Bifunctional 4-hydroxy-2-oxoglutarate aldolase/2-dehydro-3-deoxy-phosphogluconate aldolase n=1 Tax=Psychrosphaera aquimarina TaxID=2044854 RepID=A0ABU3QVU9_9GAMM|nr:MULTISPECIES: bifunctional 4-hydroxy-2-oxoglutarate aldolase/2-dehydro-3-deoxy-phosphogluconate aldolase [Psychrosphaera]MBU2918577.1 bifunctional 4-hydroxy-2-oxoglutarate aldolase/2-dehydro-3-deoxy-phosphogluconate aldolase [Psychrosphaera sp. F3M07]MDU0111564.1 bifunctional 4-hydroxy-2-oxoglutarate aldolase/2-dehydro-3-deoxy-phosphogluconate aldolase [Psychrosphaera aquimarina]
MAERNWLIDSAEVFAAGPVVPVLVIENVEDAVPIAEALMAGGIKVLEVTLRTKAAIDVIREIATHCPDAIIGAGTVTNAAQLKQVTEAGAKFAISPGLTPDLLDAGNAGSISLIPGIASISELMIGLDKGYSHFKFFPAEASGGVQSLKSIGGPFPDVRFCPTGGINPGNYKDYLALSNVMCCGGSWLCPDDIIKGKRWSEITELAKKATAGV